MTPQIKQRIEQIRRGEVPEGYKKTRAGIMPLGWIPNKEYLAKDLFSSISRKNNNGQYEVLSATQDQGVIPRSQLDVDIRYDMTNVSGYKLVEKGDFIISLRSFQGGIEYSDYCGLVSPAYTVLTPKLPISNYYYKAYFKSEDYIRRLNKGTYGIRDGKQIGYDDFGNMVIHYPPLPEQEKIAEILKTQDKVIELCEKKVEQLKQLKKVFLQKMFPKPGATVPEWRFPGFTDAWEKRKLGKNIVEYHKVTTVNNQFPPLTSSRRGIFLQTEYFAGNQIASVDNTGYNIVPYGYFTYRHMSDDEMFFFNINDIVENGIVSTLYPVFTTDENLDSRYLQYQLNYGHEFAKFAILQKQGGSRTYMYLNKLKSLYLTMPKTVDEQKKLSGFLMAVDRLITFHQRKCDVEKQNKKALMQLLLTGIVRVKT